MSDPSAKPNPFSGPGIVQSFIKLRKDSQLSEEVLWKWWDGVYIPALLETGVVKSAWRWKAANQDYDKQHMIIYKIPEMAEVAAQKLRGVPRTSDMFPTSGPVDDFTELEVRCLTLTQLYETAKQPEGTRFAHSGVCVVSSRLLT